MLVYIYALTLLFQSVNASGAYMKHFLSGYFRVYNLNENMFFEFLYLYTVCEKFAYFFWSIGMIQFLIYGNAPAVSKHMSQLVVNVQATV